MSTLYVGRKNAIILPISQHEPLLDEYGDLVDEAIHTKRDDGHLVTIYKHDAAKKHFSISGPNSRHLTETLVGLALTDCDKTTLTSLGFDFDYIFDTQQCIEMEAALRRASGRFSASNIGIAHGYMLTWIEELLGVFSFGAQSGFVIIL